jgi:uncharacterized integral membrane protein
MRVLVWLFRAFLFFTLFAFALNNQQTAAVKWFFGYTWEAPLVIIVLASFAAGTVFGVMAMAPSWWRHRRVARRATAATPAGKPSPLPATTAIDPQIPDGI